MGLAEIKIIDIKQESLGESDHDLGKNFKVKMEENILKLCEELDKEKSENSAMDFSQKRSLKIREFVNNIAQHDSVDHQMVTEIVSLKTRIEEITDEHKIAMFQNTKTVNSIVKMHEEALENKTKEVANIMLGCQRLQVSNQELLQKNQELEMNKNNFAITDSLERSHGNKPFSCKYCEKTFFQVHEVKEHIKVHNSILEVEDLKKQLKSLKTQVEELEAKLKSSQSKLAFETRL